MNEETNTELELEGIDEAWDAEDVDFSASVEPEAAEAPESAGEAAGQPEAEAGNQRQADDGTGEPQEEPAAPQEEAQAGNQRFELNHLGNVSSVSREEVIALAQKGLDYDHVSGLLGEYKELGTLESVQDMAAFLKELAGSAGQTVPELMDTTRASMLSKKEGLSQEAALERVQLDKRERAVSARENAEKAQQDAERRRQEDFAAFAKAHPEVKAQDIPREVWEAVQKGESLSAVWERREGRRLREENQRLAARLAALEQNRKNQERSAGSQQSSGQSTREAWEDLWNSEEW